MVIASERSALNIQKIENLEKEAAMKKEKADLARRKFTLNLGTVGSQSSDLGKDAGNIADAAAKAHQNKNPKLKKVAAITNASVYPLEGKSLMVLAAGNPVRELAAKVCSHPQFDSVILVLIMVSSLMLALDNPLDDPNSTKVKILGSIDYIFTFCFTIEMLSKILTMGFLFQKRTYLRDPWNILDFFVVVISLLTTFTDGDSSLSSLKSLRAFRAFRPLRMINRAPGLKLIVNCMFSSVPDVLNVSAVCGLFFLIFSIFGVSMFKGQLRECQGGHFEDVLSGTPAGDYLTVPVKWEEASDEIKSIFAPGSEFFGGMELQAGCGDNYPAEPCCVLTDGDDLEYPPEWYQVSVSSEIAPSHPLLTLHHARRSSTSNGGKARNQNRGKSAPAWVQLGT